MRVKIIKEKISKLDVERAARNSFGEMVKAVVDIEKEILTLGGGLHADGEALLLQEGSKQENLWGINIYPQRRKDEWIEFTALINIRPAQENRSMEIQNPNIRVGIKKIVNGLIE